MDVWTGQEARALRQAMRLSVRGFAEHLGVAVRTVSKWEAGGPRVQPRPDTQAMLDTALERADEASRSRFSARSRPDVSNALSLSGARSTHVPGDAEALRLGLHQAMTDGIPSGTALDGCEQAVMRYGRATRDRPPVDLFSDLTGDLVRVHRVLARCRSATSLRRLTSITARMAGLMCLTLVKLDDRAASRRWAQTARLAALEADDKATLAWVLAQEAYGLYYSGALIEAVEVARAAQSVHGKSPGVGVALAAPLEARAQAALGRERETRRSLGRAEEILSQLNQADLTASAFGYSESQLRFHEGNAWTNLGATDPAWQAQERALELCPAQDFMDRALTRLDRAQCLARDGDVTNAVEYAAKTVMSLNSHELQGIVLVRANEIINSLPPCSRNAPAARDFRDMLATKGREH